MPQDERHSSEVQEIMGLIPSWIVRWGIAVIAGIFALIIIGCCIIKYPETVTASVVITTGNPPSELVVRTGGIIDTLCVENNARVAQNDMIAAVVSTASTADIMAVKRWLKETESLSPDSFVSSGFVTLYYTLGDVSGSWNTFTTRCADYRHYLTADNIGRKKQLIEEQIAKNGEYYRRLEEQKRLSDEDLLLSVKSFRRDSVLHNQKILSDHEYETAQQKLISTRSSNTNFAASLSSTELNIMQFRQQLIELTMQEEDERKEHRLSINQARRQTVADIEAWIERYAVTTPISGRVQLLNVWSANQYVPQGAVIATVVPDDINTVIGRMQIASSGFGKVKVGQTVNIRLNGFPYMEYGVLRGRIKTLSAVPEQVQSAGGTAVVYKADVEFPDGLKTTYNRDLPLIREMDGTAEIITDDMRLIEQFVRPIISLFRN